jgi:hypothetical protein
MVAEKNNMYMSGVKMYINVVIYNIIARASDRQVCIYANYKSNEIVVVDGVLGAGVDTVVGGAGVFLAV